MATDHAKRPALASRFAPDTQDRFAWESAPDRPNGRSYTASLISKSTLKWQIFAANDVFLRLLVYRSNAATARPTDPAAAPPRGPVKIPKRVIGNISLLFMVAGLVVVRLLIHLGIFAHPWWDVLAGGFEAGTVGALADWYAVTALFREIRLPGAGLAIPLLTRHSNIILRNRRRISDNIADMVENRWLSPEAIGRQLERHAPADELLRHFDDPAHLDAALDLVRRFLHLHAGGLAGAETAAFVESLARDQLAALRFARPLGGWVRSAIERRDHEAVWDALLDTLATGLADRDLHAWLTQQVRQVASGYARRDLLKLIATTWGELTGALDYAVVASKVLEVLDVSFRSARGNPSHPVRRKLDEAVFAFASRLEAGDESATGAVEHAWARITAGAELRPLIDIALDRLAQTMSDQTRSLDTPLMRFLRGVAARQLDALRHSSADRERLSAWVREKVIALVSSRRHLIGDTVRMNLGEMADAQWSSQIQERVGDDLQWIRVNGAMVGFLAGVAIAIAKHLLALVR